MYAAAAGDTEVKNLTMQFERDAKDRDQATMDRSATRVQQFLSGLDKYLQERDYICGEKYDVHYNLCLQFMCFEILK